MNSAEQNSKTSPPLAINFDDVVNCFALDKQDRVTGAMGNSLYASPLFHGDKVNSGVSYSQYLNEHKACYLKTDEPALLSSFAPAVGQIVGTGASIIDLGPGPSESVRLKTKTILQAVAPFDVYTPVDVSADYKQDAEETIRCEFPHADVRGVVSNFQEQVLPKPDNDKSLILYMGSTISNTPGKHGETFMQNPHFEQFLSLLRRSAVDKTYLLISHDCNQDETSLHDMYESPHVHDMIKNVTHQLERDFGATGINHEAFNYVRHWNAEANCIEHCLASNEDQQFMVYDPNSERSALISIKANEEYNVVNSYKPTVGQMQHKLLASGWEPIAHQVDDAGRLATHLCQAVDLS